jgi:hypothetical protein
VAGQEIVEFEGHLPVPAADEDWPDLADAYILGCQALGREPMVRGPGAEDGPGPGE